MSREAVLPINNSYLWVSHAFTFCCHRSCQKCSAFACLSYFHGEKRKNLNGLGLGHKIAREGKFGLCESVLPLQLFPAPPVAAPPGPNTQINSAPLASAAFVCTCAALHISYFPLLDTAFSPDPYFHLCYLLPLVLSTPCIACICPTCNYQPHPAQWPHRRPSDQMRRSQTTKHWIVTRLGRRDFCIQIKRSSLSILAKHYFGLMQTFNWGITCITRDFYIHCIVLFFILYLVLNSGLRSEHQVVYLQWRFFIKLSWDKYWYAAPITMRSSQRNHLVRLKVKDFLLRLQLCRH